MVGVCAQAAREGEQDAPHSYSLAYKFVLEAPEIAETPRTTVTMQLLGPHTVKCDASQNLPCHPLQEGMTGYCRTRPVTPIPWLILNPATLTSLQQIYCWPADWHWCESLSIKGGA